MLSIFQSYKSTRRLWLLLLFFPLLSTALSWQVYNIILQEDSPAAMAMRMVFSQPWLLVLLIIFRMIPTCALYYCSYKKRGTALLSFFIWIFPITMVSTYYQGISMYFPSTEIEASLLNDTVFAKFAFASLIFCSIDLVLNLCWYILSIYMRRFNRELQFDKVSNNEKYLDAFATLQNLKNMKELKRNYLLAKQKYPEVRHVFKLEFKEQKNLLKNS